ISCDVALVVSGDADPVAGVATGRVIRQLARGRGGEDQPVGIAGGRIAADAPCKGTNKVEAGSRAPCGSVAKDAAFGATDIVEGITCTPSSGDRVAVDVHIAHTASKYA